MDDRLGDRTEAGPPRFHSRELLAEWIHEYADRGPCPWRRARVLEQDGADGADTGLILLELSSADVTAHLSPQHGGAWSVSVEVVDHYLDLCEESATGLAFELTRVGGLLQFLRTKDRELEAPDAGDRSQR